MLVFCTLLLNLLHKSDGYSFLHFRNSVVISVVKSKLVGLFVLIKQTKKKILLANDRLNQVQEIIFPNKNYNPVPRTNY